MLITLGSNRIAVIQKAIISSRTSYANNAENNIVVGRRIDWNADQLWGAIDHEAISPTVYANHSR